MALKPLNFMAMLPASDQERALNWYKEKLGLEPAGRDPYGEPYFEATDGSRFLLYKSQFAGGNEATAVQFTIEDVEGTVAELRERGVVFEEYDLGDIKTENGVASMGDLKGAWFKDTEGNIIGLSNI